VEDLHPSAGVRILLELDACDDAGARYRAAVYTKSRRLDYRLTIGLPGGAVSLAEPPPEEGAPFVEFVHAMARSLARDALAASPLRWPRRLLRWRDK